MIIRGLLSLYSWRYPQTLVYMLQSTEYEAGAYLRWFWRTTNFSRVTYRRTLEYTRPAQLLLWALRLAMAVQIAVGLLLIGLWLRNDLPGGWQFGLAILLAYPLVWAHLVVMPLALGRWFIIVPRQRRLIKESEGIFRNHPGIKLAITGSYGKTSMKELLVTVLGEGKKVAATPANKNVAISHAYFAQKLTGDEEVLIIEYGEARPGDIERFARVTHPTHAIIAGIAPAHLDHYHTVERVTKDFASIGTHVAPDCVYVNAEPALAAELLADHPDFLPYSHSGALGWKVSDVVIGPQETRFVLKSGQRSMKLQSKLIGRHQVGPLAMAAALADKLGLTEAQIKAGIAKTEPFEHRMQPYELNGAHIIDDTYNGNIEGVRAGTALLKELTAKRKIYVTPGLVDQGEASERVHTEMGELIAAAKPDMVVLMKNSVTPFIMQGLIKNGGYDKELVIQDDPLQFYTNLQAFVAAGDVVLLQNDWTDNYA